jgi:dipeptidyl aminopeptidase/acylaminoacyl peptidase
MKRANRLTIEHLWKLQRPAQPSLSPDGAQACVSVTAVRHGREQGRLGAVALLRVRRRAAPAHAAGEKDASRAGLPTGRWIAFVAKRPAIGLQKADEESQLYLIAPDGGEARRITDIATGVFGIKWFPDSRRIAFLSWVWPEEKGLKAIAKRYRTWKDDPVKAHVVEHSAYRWWDKWLTDGRTVRLFTGGHRYGCGPGPFRGHEIRALPRRSQCAPL